MIVGYRYDKDVATITWIGSGDVLYKCTAKLLASDIGDASLFVRNGELYALMIEYVNQPYDVKVAKVSTFLECTGIDTYSLLKIIDANTYIYIPLSICGKCVRVMFVGDACNVEVLTHNGFVHYDGERYWKWKRFCSGSMHYISSDPACNFEMPDRFGTTKDTRNGLILNLNVEEDAEGRYTIYILCYRTRDVIWTYASAIGKRIHSYMHVEFVTDNVVIMRTIDTAGITIFINTVDNTIYELAFCA
jgi:hypothetical protein